MERWDIFLSYARQDALRARPIAKALCDRGLTVFVDETGVRDFRSITRLIGTALGNSRLLLALYSTAYQQRPACQVELTLAYLAGQQEGDPRRRVVVINPEPTADHVHPIELRDSRHWPATGGALTDLADRLMRHLKEVYTPIGSVLPQLPPRWLPRPRPVFAGSSEEDGRLPDLWRLHSALHPHAAALFTGRTDPGVAVLRGVAPRRLAYAYALKFGTAYPGGIYWFSFDGYPSELKNVLQSLTEVRGDDELAANLSRLEVLMPDRPALWVVDGVPAGLAQPEVLLAPHRLGASILVTGSTDYDGLGQCVVLPEPGDTICGMSELPTVSERERLAAFDLQVELATRVGVQRLGAGGGSLREALSSLRSLFDTTRAVLHGYGPSVSAVRRPAEDLLGVLRPFLETWHPRLSAHEHRRPAVVSPMEHERAWVEAAEMRQALATLGGPLRQVVAELGRVSGSDLGLDGQ